MNRLSKRHFWEWFRRHNQEYIELLNKPKKEATYWMSEMNTHLRAYHKFFGFSLEWGKQVCTLTITVDGNAKHFKKVEDLVVKAPQIPGWNMVALEEPCPIDFLLEQQMQETGIDPRELSFSFSSVVPEPAVLIVYHPLCTKGNKHLIYQLAYTAVYNLLGERSFGLNIARLDVDNLSCADPDDVENLEALPDHIGRSSMIVDSRGSLVTMV